MDYQEALDELEFFKRCDECDYFQDLVTESVQQVRKSEFEEQNTRAYDKAKMRLTWAVEAQQRHQREHETEEIEEEG